MYNFTELIVALAVINKEDKLYTYQANFSIAAHICRLFFRNNALTDLETLISKFISPIRPGRSAPRIRTAKSFANFSYRIA